MNWLALFLYIAGCFSTQMWLSAAMYDRDIRPNVVRFTLLVVAWPIAAPIAFIAAVLS